MKQGEVYSGFEVVRVRPVAELEGTAVELRHQKTGAQLLWLDRPDNNKTFSVAFETIPEDDTGVFHIIEHSVLCGSKKYPVKEPFVELLKGSMSTFLNAITFPDKTMYPISSRNEADFFGLMGVYLDAVFHPAIYENRNIFRQEGWHYELHEGDAAPIYKGVVFNEMKGAMSSVDEIQLQKLVELLFPDTCYRFNSGGDPAHIPDLSYEQFLDAHRKYYHPSNARIFLDGNVPIEKTLEIIDTQYLSHYDPLPPDFSVAMQTPVAGSAEHFYEISPDEPEENKTMYAMATIAADWSEKQRIYALQALADVLAGTNESPLPRAILKQGLAQDVSVVVQPEVAQTIAMVQVRNTDPDKCGRIERTILDVLEQQASGALDREAIRAALCRMEFQLRDAEEPRGVLLAMTTLRSWLYGGDPLLYLENDETFAALRALVDTDYYETLLRETLLDAKKRVTLITKPSKTLGEQTRQGEAARIVAAQKTWDAGTTARIIAETAALEAWQQTDDTPEQLATLPHLHLCDVEDKPEPLVTEPGELAGVQTLRHPVPSRGIVHLTLRFRLTDLPLEKLPAASLLAGLFGKLPTKRHSVQELQKAVKSHIGRMHFETSAVGTEEGCRPYLVVRASVLEAETEAACALLREIMTETQFDDEDKLREIVLQTEENLRQTVISDGHAVAIARALAHGSAEDAANEALHGFTLYQWIHAFAAEFAQKQGEFLHFCRTFVPELFTRSRLLVSITGTAPEQPLAALVAALPEGQAVPAMQNYQLALASREGITIPAGISFAARAAHIPALATNGASRVLCNILSYSYLWNEVRVQGGAYGTGFNARANGDVYFYSYRDPDAARSLGVYARAADYVRTLAQEDLERFIIGAIGESEPLLTPADRGETADLYYLRGITEEDRVRMRREMMATTGASLQALVPMLEEITRRGTVCVVGSAAILDKVEGLTKLEL